MTPEERKIRKSNGLLARVQEATGLSGGLLFYAMKFGIIGIINKPKSKKKP